MNLQFQRKTLSRTFFKLTKKILVSSYKNCNKENVLHYACRGGMPSSKQSDLDIQNCQRTRMTENIQKLFADYPDIVTDLLKTPGKIEAGYFSPGRTPVYYLIQNSYHEILDTVIPAVGKDEFLKLLQHDSAAFQTRLYFGQKTPAENHRIDHTIEFICKLRAYYNEDQIVPFLDSTSKGDHINPFQDILLSMCQYRNDHSHSLNRLQRFLSQFSPRYIDQLLLNDIRDNSQVMQQVLMGIDSDYTYNYHDRVSWYKNVLDQFDQHATIMPTLLMQKRTADSMPYWQAFQSQGLIDDDLNERLKMDSTEKIQVHMKSLLTVLSKQRDVAASKRNQAQQYLGELDNINAQGDNAHEDLKKLFERMVIQMGKHQFWRQGINANKTSSAVNMDQLPDTLRQFYGHFDRIRQQAFGISDQQWCGLLKGERPRHNLSNNLNVSSSPHGTFGSGHGQQPPEPQLESEQPGRQL